MSIPDYFDEKEEILAIEIKEYLTQDLDEKEHISYQTYLDGNRDSTAWMEKALERREYIILKQLKCQICNGWVNVWENGICRCSKGHQCYNVVYDAIHSMQD